VTQGSYVASGMEVDYLIFQLTDVTVLTWGKVSTLYIHQFINYSVRAYS
jgi:hypothetical protein